MSVAGPVGGVVRWALALVRRGARAIVGSWRFVGRAWGSVRLRVTVLAAGLFAVTLVVASAILLSSLERSLIDDVRAADRAELITQAQTIRANGVPADASLVPMPGSVAMTYQNVGDDAPTLMIADDSAALKEAGLDPPPEEGSATTQSNATAERFANVAEVAVNAETERMLGIGDDSRTYVASGIRVGDVTLATASPLDQVRDTIAATRGLLWVIGPALVALVVALSWVVVGRALRPVHAVTSRVAAMGSDSLDRRVPVPRSNDEIAELARTMNSMLGRLEVSTSASRRLVSDASHELRTPVAIMRTELEVARRTDDTDWLESSDVLLGELDRLQELIDDLLLLASGDEQALAQEVVSVDDLVRDVAARRRRVPVTVTIGGGQHEVTGDEAAVRRALDHVVANAARHAESRVAVAITDTNGDGTVVVHIDDDGDGIPEDDRAEVVRRFVRLDEGRDRDSGGAGLGLAVTSDVLASHGGSLAIGDAPLGGARLTLAFPRRT